MKRKGKGGTDRPPLRLGSPQPWIAAGAVLLASLAAARVAAIVHAHEIDLWADVIVRQVEDGRAIKQRFASRVLAPYAVYYLSQLGIPLQTALKAFYATCMVVANGTCYATFARLTGSHRQGLYYLFGLTGLTVLLLWPRTHAWDFADVAVFSLLLYGIVTRRTAAFFGVLFAVAVLNRETAFFIPLWLGIDGFCRRDGRVRLANPGRLGAAFALAAAGAAYTTWARRALFTEAYLTAPPIERQTDLFGHRIRWLENAARLVDAPLDPTRLTVIGLILFVIVALLSARHRFRPPLHKVLLLLAAIFAASVTFGRIEVTRLYLPCIPLLLYVHQMLWGEPVRGDSTRSPAG